MRMLTTVLACSLLGFWSAPSAALDEAEARALVDAADRSADDRERDAKRDPVAFLVFSGVEPGARVADVGAGNGYTTELLARAVGPEGSVISHNTPRVVEKFVRESWPARLTRPANANVKKVIRPFDHPLPEGTRDLDLVTLIYVYHDTPLYDMDRDTLTAHLFATLKPGGAVIVVDHHAKAGAPVRETADTLHRIDEAVVKRDFEKAGFRLAASGEFLRHADDPRDAPFFRMDAPTDTFVHRWIKPE